MVTTRAQSRAARRRHDARLSAAAKTVQRLGRDIAFHEPRATAARRDRDAIRNFFLTQAMLRRRFGPGVGEAPNAAFMSDLFRQNAAMHAYHRGSLDDLASASVAPVVELVTSARRGGRQRRPARRKRVRGISAQAHRRPG